MKPDLNELRGLLEKAREPNACDDVRLGYALNEHAPYLLACAELVERIADQSPPSNWDAGCDHCADHYDDATAIIAENT